MVAIRSTLGPVLIGVGVLFAAGSSVAVGMHVAMALWLGLLVSLAASDTRAMAAGWGLRRGRG